MGDAWDLVMPNCSDSQGIGPGSQPTIPGRQLLEIPPLQPDKLEVGVVGWKTQLA